MSKSKLLGLLRNVIQTRLDIELKGKVAEVPRHLNEPIESSELTLFIQQNNLSENEVATLLMALAPHLSPNFFNSIIGNYLPNGGDFPEFGGVKGRNHRGILPTGETVLFVLAGHDMEKRAELTKLFSEDHFFARKGVLHLEEVPSGEPRMSGRLILDQEYVDLFTSGVVSKPRLSNDFPALRIETGLKWDDLILNEKTSVQIREIETWLKYNDTLLNDWGMKNRIRQGYRVLFTGPPGTGKTMTACLLGKYTNRDVYRIDLSMVISKYIGETEKNLSKLFNRAENKDWILFFDEADALFGKRTGIRDAHDKYANQEVSYLLQRIENHAGLVILATNMKNNIDTSFTRRFNAIIDFENPSAKERLEIWQKNIPPKIKLDKQIELNELARKYEVTGANIVNIIHFACLKTLEKKSKTIGYSDLIDGIRKEYAKEGKMVNLNI